MKKGNDKSATAVEHKLALISEQHTDLLKQFDAYYELFSHLVTRLSNACKGFNPELDQNLGKLKNLLKNNSDINKLKPLVSDVSTKLQSHTQLIEQHVLSVQKKVGISGKKLQNVQGLPERTRRNLRALLTQNAAQKGDDNITHLLPRIEQLLDLYEQALAAKLQVPKSDLLPATAAETDAKTQSKGLANQVLSLLAELAFMDEHQHIKNDIQANLLDSVKPEQVLQCCIEIIKLIVDSFANERKAAQAFLFSLNDALSSVHNALKVNQDESLDSAARSRDIGKELHLQVDKMRADVEQATDLEQLKVQTQERLNHIAEALLHKSSLEKQERQRLETAMLDIQKRLTEMEKKAAQYLDKLEKQKVKSRQDPLTEIPNRAAFDERVDIEYRRWQRQRHDWCIAVIDIDFFKRINDQFGHSVGDKTLQVVAKILKKSIRSTDFVARYGGEEFVLIFSETDINQAVRVLNKIRESVSKIPFKFKGTSVTVTLSAGVSAIQEDESIATVFDRADSALYQAKHNGRNNVETG